MNMKILYNLRNINTIIIFFFYLILQAGSMEAEYDDLLQFIKSPNKDLYPGRCVTKQHKANFKRKAKDYKEENGETYELQNISRNGCTNNA